MASEVAVIGEDHRAAVDFLNLALASAKKIEDGHGFTAYTISGPDGSDYLSRILTPRTDAGRIMIHKIHRADNDRHEHNHPWKDSQAIVLHGGYVEERGSALRRLIPGDVNRIRATDYHRIVQVEPETWTLFLAGERLPAGWGFWVRGRGHVPHETYRKERGL